MPPPLTEAPTLALPSRAHPPRAHTAATLPDRYQVLQEIARGGMGVVLRVRDLDLDRVIAVKVLRDDHADNPDVLLRFLDEARIAGRLQHPGVVPIHEIGRFADNRPFFTMKLVEGTTLADRLAKRQSPGDDLTRFLSVFEQVCNTIAYVHSQGVIHRDLKPANVMVGSFGEVQVMDWGVSKRAGEAERRAPNVTEAAVPAPPAVCPSHVTIAGTFIGTPAYVAPEQARGDAIDERADVFGLGAILCEILTGLPPYHLPSGSTWPHATQGRDLGDAMRRLDECGLDAELVRLAKDCLAEEPGGRPADAAAVAVRVIAYREGVQERLRKAELERTAAVASARAERRARRLFAGLTLAGVLLVAGVCAAGWWWYDRRASTHKKVDLLLAQAGALSRRAAQEKSNEQALTRWREAAGVTEQAWQVAQAGAGEDDRLRVEAERLRLSQEIDRLEEILGQLRADRAFADELIELRIRKEEETERPDTDREYLEAFRRHGLDVEGATANELAARVKARSPGLIRELIAALDDWCIERRQMRRPEPQWRRLLLVANAIDDSEWRIALRERLSPRGSVVPRESLALDVIAQLTRAGSPSAVLLGFGVEKARRRLELRELAARADLDHLPPASVTLLATQLFQEGDQDEAVALLRGAQKRQPGDVWLNHDLARALQRHRHPQIDEAIRFYTAARAGRPEIGHALAHALASRGRTQEAIDVYRELTRLRPRNAHHFNCLGTMLDSAGSPAEAERHLREAIRLNPTAAATWRNLGMVLARRGRHAEAEKALLEAIRLRPDFGSAYRFLGRAVWDQGRLKEAEPLLRRAVALGGRDASARAHLASLLALRGADAEALRLYREAVALSPDEGEFQREYGRLLRKMGRNAEAVGPLTASVRLEPRDAPARLQLGFALMDLGRPDSAVPHLRSAVALAPADVSVLREAAYGLGQCGCYAESIAHYEEVIRLNPTTTAHFYNLGNAYACLREDAAAVCWYRRDLDNNPGHAEAYCNLGMSLRKLGCFAESLEALERGHELGRGRRGWGYPSDVWVRDGRRLVAIAARVEALAEGREQPTEAERVLAAQACYWLGRYAAEVRLLEKAKAGTFYRLEAAAGGLRAGLGEGIDAPDEEEKRSRCRRLGLGWLREEVAAARSLLSGDAASAAKGRRMALGIENNPAWHPAQLGKLSVAERAEWLKVLASLRCGRVFRG